MKILIVEDNLELGNAVSSGLTAKGYLTDVAIDGEIGLKKARNEVYDLIILDINLPKLNGFEIAKTLRKEESKTPIIALTAKDQLEDKLKGFDLGFDDYITKPFEFLELVARMEALIRRSKPNDSLILQTKNILLDPKKRTVYVDEKDINLSRIEFNLLEYLLRNKGLVINNTEIIEHVWAEEPDLNDPPIRSHIKNIRKKIGDENFQIIKTVPGIGYIIE